MAGYVMWSPRYNFHMVNFPQNRRLRRIFLCLVFFLGGSGWALAAAAEFLTADHVVVHKADRRLSLYNGNKLLGEYKVKLGLSPVGTK